MLTIVSASRFGHSSRPLPLASAVVDQILKPLADDFGVAQQRFDRWVFACLWSIYQTGTTQRRRESERFGATLHPDHGAGAKRGQDKDSSLFCFRGLSDGKTTNGRTALFASKGLARQSVGTNFAV